MGRIKGTVIKRATKELLKEYPNEFTEDFEKNKPLVSLHVKQKKFRNSVAGYIARIVKRQNKKEKRIKEEEKEREEISKKEL